MMSEYANRNPRQLGEPFARHMMTAENLRDKAAIAEELAFRDQEIDRLRAERAGLLGDDDELLALRAEVEALRAASELALGILWKALRRHAIVPRAQYFACDECGYRWSGKDELHAPDCLAAPAVITGKR